MNPRTFLRTEAKNESSDYLRGVSRGLRLAAEMLKETGADSLKERTTLNGLSDRCESQAQEFGHEALSRAVGR